MQIKYLASLAVAFEKLAGIAASVGSGVDHYLARFAAAATRYAASRIAGQPGIAALTGSTNETTVGTIVIPAGLLDEPGAIAYLTAVFRATGTNGTKTIKVKQGADVIYTVAMAAGGLAHGVSLTLWNAAGTLYAAVDGAATVAIASDAVVAGQPVTLTFTGQLANGADSMKFEAYAVEVFPA